MLIQRDIGTGGTTRQYWGTGDDLPVDIQCVVSIMDVTIG